MKKISQRKETGGSLRSVDSNPGGRREEQLPTKSQVHKKGMLARLRGFTLIEILVVVAVVAILAAVAFPSYTESVTRVRRSDATTALAEAAQTLERCFTQFNVFNDGNCSIQSGTAFLSSEGFYSIAPTTTVNTFSLTASPVVGGVQAGDSKCTSFTLTSTGVRTAAGTLGNDCWD